MRTAIFCLALAALAGCTRQQDTNARRDTDSSARQAGREAYQASRDLKRDAKEAAQQLRDAGKNFRQGWEEQKHASRPDDTAADHTRTNHPRR